MDFIKVELGHHDPFGGLGEGDAGVARGVGLFGFFDVGAEADVGGGADGDDGARGGVLQGAEGAGDGELPREDLLPVWNVNCVCLLYFRVTKILG